ncbi:MAG: type II/IV secretion system ATPase subunit [Nanoarchaeota archaeon]
MAETNLQYEIVREGEDTILKVDYEQATAIPSIEDSTECMFKTSEKLIENPGITKIVFFQKRDYEYDENQTLMLGEIARLSSQLLKQKQVLSYENLGSAYAELQPLIYSGLRSDPVATFVLLKRILRRETIRTEKELAENELARHTRYRNTVHHIIQLLENTILIKAAKPLLIQYHLYDRSVYRRIFRPTIKPDFMFTKLMAQYPLDGEEVDTYMVGKETEVTIFKVKTTIQYLYHITPPEFRLTEEKYQILDQARSIIAEHKPEKSEFIDPERMRSVFFNVGLDLVEELASYKNLNLRQKEIEELTRILVRYTVGFGLIEVLLQDDKIQDITINSPMGQIPIFVVHQDYDYCVTNIIPTITEGDSWASKMRLMSGRPLDEANPILDTELLIPGATARVAVISPPINPTGLAYALRRHRDKPWTLPLLINNKMISPLAAGTLSFLIDGSRTMLIAGTRSAGKTSVLGAVMTEIMRKYRMITIEDTLELPVAALRKLGYNIQSMKVAAALTKGTAEVPADEGIRTTLRLGDSSLIVGEVRSTEAKALYEAMRVGALANVVAGTIHGDSPYGVFDRVVNDLGVPRTSFKATDIMVVANPIKSADGLHRWRRITQITEVGKHWENDPSLENGFRDLFRYEPKKDILEPTADLLNGESDIIKAVAGNVKEWAGNWNAVWDNIQLRAKLKETLVQYAHQIKNLDILEAGFVVQANDEFHRISDRVKDEVGTMDSSKIFSEWDRWLKQQLRGL